MSFVDHFGGVGNFYTEFRPIYPDSLYTTLLSHTEGPRNLAIDVGAGNGQATLPLAKYYKKVIGFEPSEGQIKGIKVDAENVEFRQSIAEKIDLPSESVDLIITAQAVHWFDLEKFYNECWRLLRVGGTLAIWGYGTLKVEDDPAADKLFQNFYANTLGEQYWPANRKHIDNEYKDINPCPPFPSFMKEYSSMSKVMDFNHFKGYLSTFSGLKQYREKTKSDPLEPLCQELLANTAFATRSCQITWPIFLLTARKLIRK
eukprot:TRINITY_DN6112_c0_g1_i1.p1 TRINITY_DN6112_c0_g1~~TRINITY_DN6112_c0_g1_i1.p1  ORF type:complete len:280 (-),score=57.27 TRINITY_DN6112_c0_g1_i1:102-878(-)